MSQIRKVCQQCRKIFHVYPYRKNTAKFCSKSCGCKFRTGEFHNAFKSGRILRLGYVCIHINKKYIYEHRFIMEQYLKRKLSKNESVHHINGIKTDNRIKNLIVMQKRVHDSIETKKTVERKPYTI